VGKEVRLIYLFKMFNTFGSPGRVSGKRGSTHLSIQNVRGIVVKCVGGCFLKEKNPRQCVLVESPAPCECVY